MTSLFLKSLLGAVAVLIIAMLSKSKSFYIAGLVPLFPTFALIAHFIVGSERDMEALRQTALFGLCSLRCCLHFGRDGWCLRNYYPSLQCS
ncbi:hypothetical protein HB762_23625 [Vibrio campbellii]|uniref:Inner membrane protein n=1 Tax=Vibrio campbellii TaxID=680 RepID=A0ABY5IKX0_9VIBR|nr:hypothetical protein HB760_17825 [Vibrio campbellii]UTZ34200.1 hypothetical protein HB762_23625 [Vibrio campbellii]